MPTNGDRIKASYDAFHRGDLDAALEIYAPGIEWTHPDGMSDHGLGGTRKGVDEVKQFMAKARTIFSEVRPEPHEVVDAGDQIVVIGVHAMRCAQTGLSASVPFAHYWRMADGKATHFVDYHDTAEVRRIMGLTECSPADDA
jgi:ketosteroid isomerase-like protein